MRRRTLDERQALQVERLCELIVPGSSRAGSVAYVDALLAGMPAEERSSALAAFEALAPAADGGTESLAAHERTGEFALVRALAIEAYYSDFVAPDAPGPGAWAEIDFQPPRAADLVRDWSWLGAG